jgi:hypothetical protein
MANPGLPDEIRQRYKDAIEQALRDGFTPHGMNGKGPKHSATREAYLRLKAQGYETTPMKLYRFIDTEQSRKALGDKHFCPNWDLYSPPGVEPARMRKGVVHRWILTAAQDDTDVHLRFWTNLQVFAKTIGAQISVAGLTYQTLRHTDRKALTNTYRPEVREHLRFDPMDCGPVLWCAEMNTLITAARPLSSLEGYSRGRDAVFPHTKQQYATVPQAMGDHVPSLITTGVVTVENYIDKKAGLKARFHHILGAVVVETNDAGEAWCWHIQAAPDGSFQHHDVVVRDGVVTRGHRVAAIVHGDIHMPNVDEDMVHGIWGRVADSFIDSLKPKFQFFHDLIDFEAYSRHNEGDHFHHAQMEVELKLSVPDHLEECATFLSKTSKREYCQSVMVLSNHDRRFHRWCKANLPANASIENSIFWHQARIAQLEAIRSRDENFDLVLWALRENDPRMLEDILFVPHGGSFVICQEHGGIECGWHGDDGPNGARGAPSSYAKMARKIVRGHEHSPSILDGTTTVGILGHLNQGYNKGPSSWKHASAIVYDNGKRTLATFTKDGRWRA